MKWGMGLVPDEAPGKEFSGTLPAGSQYIAAEADLGVHAGFRHPPRLK